MIIIYSLSNFLFKMVHRLLDKQVIILSLLSLLNGDYPAKDELPINMTKEEITRINEIYTMGRDTDPPPFPVRNVAEFERMQGVIIRYPFGISLPLITEISENVIISFF